MDGHSAEAYLEDIGFTGSVLLRKEGADEIMGSERAKGYHQGVEVAPYQMQIAYSAGEMESTIEDLEKW